MADLKTLTVALSLYDYHPSYCSPDADLILLSTDSVKFRVHSLIMTMASEMRFGDMAEIIPNTKKECDNPVRMYERSDVIKAILDIIYPNQDIPKIDSYEFAERLLAAADKLHLRKVMSTVRGCVMLNSSQVFAINLWSSTRWPSDMDGRRRRS